MIGTAVIPTPINFQGNAAGIAERIGNDVSTAAENLFAALGAGEGFGEIRDRTLWRNAIGYLLEHYVGGEKWDK